jgi:hypothetical protein
MPDIEEIRAEARKAQRDLDTVKEAIRKLHNLGRNAFGFDYFQGILVAERSRLEAEVELKDVIAALLSDQPLPQ